MPVPVLDFRNTNSLWCSVIAETLVRLGLHQVVIAPGSRSAPLTFAFTRHPRIEAIPVLDERSAAFFALGLARQHRRPTALVCTSGTAAANFLPAIIEAHESGVPLLVFTADRPPEMRDCAAGQAIDQQKLYGGQVAWYHELAVPEVTPEMLGYLRQTIMHAFARTQDPAPGPVHLNAPFRDPLPPLEDGRAEQWQAAIEPDAFFAHVEPVRRAVAAAAPWAPRSGACGVIVAGPAQPADPVAYGAAVAQLAAKLGWPVLADGLSSLRGTGAANPWLVSGSYNGVLRSPPLATKLRPEIVLCLGEWPASKQLRQWLKIGDAEMWMLGAEAKNRDALHGRTRLLPGTVEGLAAALPAAAEPGDYVRAWLRADRAATATLDFRLAALAALFEGKASWLLSQHLPAETPVFIANSMPVRDVDFFWQAGDRRHRMFFNRGANGIDGTLSTALGVAHGNRPAVLLSGDLALLHDTNGFLLRPRMHGSLTVVLINNRGGGIFEMLPVAKFDPPFEEFFAMPQEVDFGRLCAAYGAAHTIVRDWAHFTELISTLPAEGLRVLEVRADRKRDAALRRELVAATAQAAEAAIG
jgi:2-succinyl-5-enolpyruvyl-6-hydroxy-3-cyclohexene-1-carboxylate synthase